MAEEEQNQTEFRARVVCVKGVAGIPPFPCKLCRCFLCWARDAWPWPEKNKNARVLHIVMFARMYARGSLILARQQKKKLMLLARGYQLLS